MSETPRRVLHLIVEGFAADKLPALPESSSDTTEVFALTEATAREALEKIFAADTVTVWGKLS